MTPSEATELQVRPAAPEDAPALAQLYLLSRRTAPGMPPAGHSDEEVRRWMGELLAAGTPRSEAWVAERGDGMAVGLLLLEDDWLHSLYVHPEHRGRGTGTVLLELAQARRPDGFSLWVFETNRAARGFYRRHGFTELERTDGSANEERAPDVRMCWAGRDPLGYLRRQIDEVDDEIGRCLARRAALTRAVQEHKPVPGEAGRDPERERTIAQRMAGHAPDLGADRLERVVNVVITESLAAAEASRDRPPPAG